MKITSMLLALLCIPMLFTACAATTYRDDVSAEDILSDIQAALPSDGYHAADEDYLSVSSFGDDLELIRTNVTDWAVALSDQSDTQPDRILIFRAADTVSPQTVADAVHRHGESLGRLRDYYRMYAPREVSKLDNVSVKVCGQYVLMTVLDDQQTVKAQEAFQQALLKR